MGSGCSCRDRDPVPDDHQNQFKVVNVDDDGNELGSGVMELTEGELVLHTRKRFTVRWPYLCLRRYGYDSNLFSFESGRHCQTGQGIFAFKCVRAEEIFNMLQDIMHTNRISVVEEAVQEEAAPMPLPTSCLLPLEANGAPLCPSLEGDASRPSSRHSSTRLPSVGTESTHPLLVTDETVHTYVNTTVVQQEDCEASGLHLPVELGMSDPEPQVLLDHSGAKFTLGPTPVQRQLMAKKRQPNSAEVDQGRNTQPGGGAPVESDGDKLKQSSGTPRSSEDLRKATAPPTQSNHWLGPISDDTGIKWVAPSSEPSPSPAPVWVRRKPYSEEAAKTPCLNGHPTPPQTDPSRCYVNTESALRPHPWRGPDRSPPSMFKFDLHWPGLDPHRQLHYIELEMERGSGSSSPHTPCTPTPPLAPPATRRTELYAIIDVERTVAMSNLQKAMPREDGASRKTRHNSNELPV
ncbi:fibroblast growth factor receptor substrate 2-like [Brienomyrus brachyistius]|uniref:fibroblast growth factor receptor substrate 2-like n=1 Tax=Brienomyrus brachyistius TaxID=42636 RepID=UPI0020B422AD|nr:fibroblast growth factor receptor substrate 2-like [Brienomyrus brachyistius]